MNVPLSNEEKIKILNGDDLYGIMQRVLLREEKIDRNKEHFWIIGLENNNRMLFIELVSLGSVNTTIAEPMEVFSFALQKQAVKIILVHNHPSGELTPSEQDKDQTDRFIQVGIIVNVPVLDHFIISERSYYSFEVSGLLDQLKLSTKYVPPYILEERLRKDAQAIAERSVVLRESEIALKLLEMGNSIEDVSLATGLSIEEVQALGRGE